MIEENYESIDKAEKPAFSLQNEAQPAFEKSLWDGSAFRFTKH